MRNMLKAVAIVAALIPAVSFAAIANSKHDLSSASTAVFDASAGTNLKSTNVGQICVFCHTPHGVGAANQKLIWNRGGVAAGYGFQTATITNSGTTLPTIGNVQQASKACLSCHDGVTGLGALTRGPSAGTITPSNNAALLTNQWKVTSGASNNDVSGNHPVSVPYPGNAANATYYGITTKATQTDYKNLPVATTTTVQLYVDTAGNPGIECGSCHDPHGVTGTSYFLRTTVNSSTLCLVCHNK